MSVLVCVLARVSSALTWLCDGGFNFRGRFLFFARTLIQLGIEFSFTDFCCMANVEFVNFSQHCFRFVFAGLLAEILVVSDFMPHVETIEVPQAPLLEKHNYSREVSSRCLASFILSR